MSNFQSENVLNGARKRRISASVPTVAFAVLLVSVLSAATLFSLCFAYYSIGVGMGESWTSFNARSWPTVSAKIVDKHCCHYYSRRWGNHAWIYRAVYRYTVGGNTYQTEAFSPGLYQVELDHAPSESEVVYYNPRQPEESYINPGAVSPRISMGLTLLLLGLTLAGMTFYQTRIFPQWRIERSGYRKPWG